MVEPVEARRSRTQTILLGVIAACLIIIVVVFVVVPIIGEVNARDTADLYSEIGSGLDAP